jgi:RNA polymerase sigma factor (sigma-70 family)
VTVNEIDFLAKRFEEHRGRLQEVAYRMLGSLSDAEDAVQESWLRLSRSDPGGIENLGGWLTTVIARVSLDMLRSRQSRREEPLDLPGQDTIRGRTGNDPEQEAVLADSVGLALLVVLDTLEPAERLAFVLHDMFAVPFEEIAPVVGRSPVAARQLASRARRRVQGKPPVAEGDLARQQIVVEAFLAASRAGDFDALVAVLDPDVVLRADGTAMRSGRPLELRGAAKVAKLAGRGGARAAQAALVNGAVGVIVAPRGRLLMVLRFTVARGKVVEIEAVGDPDRVRRLDLAVLE